MRESYEQNMGKGAEEECVRFFSPFDLRDR